MKQAVSLITLAVHDFDGAVRFYRDVLGWRPFQVTPGTIAFFGVGSLVLSLCEYGVLRDDVGRDLATAPFSGVTLAVNLPDPAGVDATFAALRRAGVAIVKPPVKAAWGGYSGYFADPEGHLWEVAHNPGFQYDQNGTMLVPDTPERDTGSGRG